jgi:hypothetical protein
MGTTTLVSVEEYLRTSFPDADREYIDGRIVERNVGEVDHSDVQSSILHYIRTHYKKHVWAGVAVRCSGEENPLPDSGCNDHAWCDARRAHSSPTAGRCRRGAVA